MAGKIIYSLESRGEEAVRTALIRGEFGPSGLHHSMVKEWLAAKDASRAETKDKETLSIARIALRNSKWANIIAITAMILSVIMAIIQILKP